MTETPETTKWSENPQEYWAQLLAALREPVTCPACPICRDTGMVQCPEQDGTGMYEQACPEKVHDGQPCPACGGAGYTEGPGCNCGVGPAGYYGMHERYCGLEPCPAGCQFVGLIKPAEA